MVKMAILIFAVIIEMVQGRPKFCTQRYCHKCEQVLATGEPGTNLYGKCDQIHSTPGCCDIYRAGSGGLFRVFTFQKCDGVKSLEDFSFEEIKRDTELLKSEELHVESEEALGKAEARFDKDCEFSMESPGMIFMYGATLILVGLAIIGIYVAKRKTQLKQRLAIGEDAIGSGILSAFLTIIPTFDRRSSRSSKKASTRRKSKTETEKILSSTP